MKLDWRGRIAQVALLSLMACGVGNSYAQVGASAAQPGAMGPGTGTAPAPGAVPCPFPFSLPPLVASGNFVNVPDMPNGWNTHAHQGIGGTAVNTWSAYSFTLPKRDPKVCCRITSAHLTVVFKALQGGATGSSTSGNDRWAIMSRGTSIAPSEPIFDGSAVTTGQTVTKTVTITNAAALGSGFLSVFAEDDTEIVSATLVLSGCCLDAPPK